MPSQFKYLGLSFLALALSSASAQAQGFDVQRFKPAANQQDNYFTLHSTHTLGGGRWQAGLVLDYANDPLVLVDDAGERVSGLVADQLTASLLFALGLTDAWEVSAAVPLVVLQQGSGSPPAGVPSGGDAGFGIGDLRLGTKLTLLQQDTESAPGGFGVALALEALLPTGDEAAFQGEGLRLAPRAIVDYAFGRGLRLSAQAGYIVRPESQLLGTDVNDTLSFGLGADLPIDAARAFHALAELSGDVSILASDIDASEVPIEAIVGGRYFHDSGLMAEAGFGFGMNVGLGTPDYRLLAGVTYRPPVDRDPDGDGYIDDDACPERPEDFDRFQDEDGCPEPDNDGDGVLDVDDKCPRVAEDRDAFEDEDGCPEPDNDGDGVLDVDDKCPRVAEDRDAFEDEDGCVDPDNDRDGVLDAADACPNEPEDTDGFDDADGCPDPDNDKDGLLDPNDACPEQAEDFDGFEDDDGCPEQGEGMVRLTCDKIDIQDRVYFDTASDRIQERSFGMLDQVAAVLKSASYIKKLRIEGHTDDRGNDASNLELSKRRASSVRRYLVEHGIEEARIDSEGFGETRPIAANKKEAGRAQNRRVEFVIVQQDSRCEK